MSRDARRGLVPVLRPCSRIPRLARLGLVCAVVGSAVLAACGGGGSAKKPGPPPLVGAQAADRQLVEGRSVYAKYCVECHGLKGEGGIGPEIAGGRTARDFTTAAQQADVVEHGFNTMPGFQGILSRGQIDAVVRYQREVL
jgi:mono/diheme cytochrome c family protein